MFKNLTMWHEARKQERKIRDLIVDYKKRAERRRDFYEKIKADPTQFLQLHGRPVKIHLDPAVAIAGDSPANMMPWQGRQDVLIDRFDVRAHLDIIPEYPSRTEPPAPEELSREERLINYERYRIIVQNDFLGIEEEKFLHQLYLEEQFGPISRPDESTPPPGEKENKKRREKGAAIPYSYDGSNTQQTAPAAVAPETATTSRAAADAEKPEEEEEEDSDVDFDLCVDVSQIGPQQAHELNLCGAAYGMNGNDFFSFLNQDIEEKESLRLAREQEEEKAMYSGRKSRRERRAFRERRLQGRKISPPSYAARTSPTYDPYRVSTSKSRSRSRSPVNAGQITYITSFGGEEEEEQPQATVVPGPVNMRAYGADSSYHHGSNASVCSATAGSSAGSQSSSSRRNRSRSPRSSSWRRRRDRSPSSSSRSSQRRRSGMSPSGYRNRSHSRERDRFRRGRSPYGSDQRSRSRRTHRSSSSDRSPPPSGRHQAGGLSVTDGSKNNGQQQPLQHSNPVVNDQSPVANSAQVPATASGSQSPHGSTSPTAAKPPPPPIRRYYGRRGKSSSSELEDSDTEEKKEPSPPKVVKPVPPPKIMNTGFGNSGAGTKPASKLTPQERLKKKMQALLNRQYKADKRAERMRHEKMEQERQDREDELREMAIKLRRRERERRHRMKEGDEDDETWDDDSRLSVSSLESYSPSQSPSPPPEKERRPEPPPPPQQQHNHHQHHQNQHHHQQQQQQQPPRPYPPPLLGQQILPPPRPHRNRWSRSSDDDEYGGNYRRNYSSSGHSSYHHRQRSDDRRGSSRRDSRRSRSPPPQKRPYPRPLVDY